MCLIQLFLFINEICSTVLYKYCFSTMDTNTNNERILLRTAIERASVSGGSTQHQCLATDLQTCTGSRLPLPLPESRCHFAPA